MNSELGSSVLEPKESRTLDVWLWKHQFTFLSLFHHFAVEINHPLTSLLHRAVGRIKLVQASTAALEQAEHGGK